MGDSAWPGSHSLVSLPRNYFRTHCSAECTAEGDFLDNYNSLSYEKHWINYAQVLWIKNFSCRNLQPKQNPIKS